MKCGIIRRNEDNEGERKMQKINVLVFGNSGVGKSTLINAVCKSDQAETGIGKSVTKEMKIYENEEIQFRLIDTMGLDYNFRNRLKINSDIKKWTKLSVKDEKQDRYIHAIWYCLDATSRRIFDDNRLCFSRTLPHR